MVPAKTTIHLLWRRQLVLIVCHEFFFAASTLSLNRIDLSFHYAVWVVLGVLLTVAMRILYPKELITDLKVI